MPEKSKPSFCCPACNKLIGQPVDMKGNNIAISKNTVMLCAGCLEILSGNDDGQVEVMAAVRRTEFLLFKPDFMQNLFVAYKIHKYEKEARGGN